MNDLTKIIIAFIITLLIALQSNAATYVIYYPELEMIKSQGGYPMNGDMHIIIKTQHMVSLHNYCYMKVLRNVSNTDKIILMPDKNIDTLEVIKYGN